MRKVSLAEQRKRLESQLQARETRREDTKKRHRLEKGRGPSDDTSGAVPSSPPRKRSNATGGIALGPAAAMHRDYASDIPTIPSFHCPVCNLSFNFHSEMEQHKTGPAHAKAVERAQQEQELFARGGAARDAIAAATWKGNDMTRRDVIDHNKKELGRAKAQQAAQRAKQDRMDRVKNIQQSMSQTTTVSHADMVAQVRQAKADGGSFGYGFGVARGVSGAMHTGEDWMPPSLAVPTATKPRLPLVDTRRSGQADEGKTPATERSTDQDQEEVDKKVHLIKQQCQHDGSNDAKRDEEEEEGKSKLEDKPTALGLTYSSSDSSDVDHDGDDPGGGGSFF